MLWKEYMFDLRKWKATVFGENPKDDIILGFFDTPEEAQSVLDNYTE